jgi:hypothetical protein
MGKVAWDYIVPVKQPSDLKGTTPGKLPESLLVKVPGGRKAPLGRCICLDGNDRSRKG